MAWLGILTFLSAGLTLSAAMAQEAQVGTQSPLKQAPDAPTPLVALALGADKQPLPCPEFCATARVTDPAKATVGEREVLMALAAAAAGQGKLRLDSRRTALVSIEKFPSTVSPAAAQSVVTQQAFRPALDPVLAEPTQAKTE